MSYQMVSLGGDQTVTDKIAADCISLKSADIDTKAAREKTFKTTAKCAAEAACAYYSGGMAPPGACATVAAPIADAAIQVWNSVYSLFAPDDAYERAVLAAQVMVPTAYVQLQRLSVWFAAHYHNVIAGLIALHDKELPDKKGALGSGGPKELTLALAESKYNKPEYYPYLYYSNNKPAALALNAAGAPAASCLATGSWCDPPKLIKVYTQWVEANPTASPIAQLQKIQEVSAIHKDWSLKLDAAALAVQSQIVAESTKRRMMFSKAMKLLLQAEQPMSPVTKTVLVAGAGGLLWWLGKRLL